MRNKSEVDVPDSIRPYLNEIAGRLWAKRAAVMVGAGFSKNAGAGFPDWNQLGDLFYYKAHGITPDPGRQKYLNVLRLAEEVQAAIGRPALESLLRSNIPDLDIEPSNLHVELLELPWVDVFTTNYDTLLERASSKVLTRRYEPVVNKEDIPYAVKPRIVKLHGSFPSERPFIITEEDYRRYPYEYAPFVNTVQQALLENTFCLIGFSGDDPNFLQWTGWIRDNLGKDKCQKIYLIGVFDLSPARKQLLAQRGVIVVDLSCCPGIERHDHKKALNHFFQYINAQKPDPLNWPTILERIYPSNPPNVNDFLNITNAWQQQRQTYPGWLILPYSNRVTLWLATQDWVSSFPTMENIPVGLDIQYAFELIWRLEKCLLPIFSNIAEYCENLLAKYWPFQFENPPSSCQLTVENAQQCDMNWNELRNAWVAVALGMLRFYREEGERDKLLKIKGELHDLRDFLTAEQREFLSYEEVLYCLFSMDLPSAKDYLKNWHPDETQPYWVTKRAVALAEVDQSKEVDEIIRLSLFESRKKSNASSVYSSISTEAYQILLLRYILDAASWNETKKPATAEEEKLIRENLKGEWNKGKYLQRSEAQRNKTIKQEERFNNFREDWKDLLNNRLGQRKTEWDQLVAEIRDCQREKDRQQQNARWDELKAIRCDPWNELKLYELELDRPISERSTIIENCTFDIGQVSRTFHYHGMDQELLAAYSFLRFAEEIGLPYRIGSLTVAKKTALASLQRISQHSPYWAIATLARLGDGKAIDNLFSRVAIYKFTTNEADELIYNYLNILRNCRNDIRASNAFRNDTYAVRLAQLLPEIMSRLCCKCSSGIKKLIINFIAEIYNSSYKMNYRGIKNLTQRLFYSMSKFEQYSVIPELLKISIPEELTHIIKNDFLNPFLLLTLNEKPESVSDVELSSDLVDRLLSQAGSDNEDQRCWAITSLVTLHNLQLLDDDQDKQLGKVLWEKVDQYGLPDHTDFYKFAFLLLPRPEGTNPRQQFKDYVKNTPFPIQTDGQDTGVRITGGDIPLVDEIIGASSDDISFWTTGEAIELLQRLLQWWNADKNRLAEKEECSQGIFPSIAEEFQQRFSRAVELLTTVIGPKLSIDSPDDIKNSLSDLLMDMRMNGLHTLQAETACLHIYPELRSDVYNRVNDALISNLDHTEKDGLNAIAHLISTTNGAHYDISEYAPSEMLSQYIKWSHTSSLKTALLIVIRILQKSPKKFTANIEDAVRKRLDRLFTETSYSASNSNLSFDEKLAMRRLLSILTSEFYAYRKSQALSIPDFVEKWREACLSPNEFAEIRNAWLDHEIG
ncbi:SIR2 family protein [Desulfovibrio desulfuricans]|uniref:anti-phage defense-associated sirtuin Dsr2 n=1 Tax=Desulfovibrio desulfuricans TaxID=876 RepID=UPI001F31DEB4|nr:anti-phage defense-associated sirtuin Dsr2 [Desulfovibrio desulfuricans]UIA98817.1 SIR2 family protein [Desulfovibrio desulfuricans]